MITTYTRLLTPALWAPVLWTLSAAAPAQPATAQEPLEAGAGTERQERELGRELAAIGTGLELTFAELDELLVWRHGRSPEGQGALREYNKLLLIDKLGQDAGIEISRADLNKGWEEFDTQLKESGVEGGARTYLAEQGVSPEVFRDYLRLGMVHERLTRLALGVGPDAPLSGEQQTMWLDDVIRKRGFVEHAHPWTDGPVSSCGDLTITRDQFIRHLREQLPADDITDACYELLLEKSVRSRLPDISEEALGRAVDEEIERRRRATARNPKFKGASYEQLLGAQGLSLEALKRDPSVRVASLAQIWIGRTYDDEDLREVYTAERNFFDGMFGESIEVYAILRRAALFKNEYNPRTFDEAMAELGELGPRIKTLDDFKRIATTFSEDTGTNEQGGRLGYVARGALKVPEEIRGAVFGALAKGGTTHGQVLGPIRLPNGVVLLALGERRPAPKWDTMKHNVHRELRHRFLDETLHPDSVATWLDAAK